MDKKIDRIDQVINCLFVKWEGNSNFVKELRKNPQAVLEKCFDEMRIVPDQETKARIVTIANKVKSTPEHQLKEFMGKRS